MRNWFAFVLLLLPMHFAGADPSRQMQAGQWETTLYATNTEGASEPVSRSLACHREEEIASENAAIPKDERCNVTDYVVDGDTVRWQIACANDITGNGTITFEGDQRYNGQLTLLVRSPGKPGRVIANRFSGQRIGECPQ